MSGAIPLLSCIFLQSMDWNNFTFNFMFTFTLTLCKWTHKEADTATFSQKHTHNRKEIKMVCCV